MKNMSNKLASNLCRAGAWASVWFATAAHAVNDLPGGPSVRQLNLPEPATKIAAAQNSLHWMMLILCTVIFIGVFAVMFYWTPPHFWALAIKYKDDYSAADVPMLPSVVSLHKTALRILLYTLLLWGLTLVFSPVADMGLIYLVSAIALGAAFTWFAVKLLREPNAKAAMKVFTYSITYITLLFGAMAVDVLVRNAR